MFAWYDMVKMAFLCLSSKLHSLYVVMKQKKIIQTGIEVTPDKCLIITFQNWQGHQKKGKYENTVTNKMSLRRLEN